MDQVPGNPRSAKECYLKMDVRRSATKHGIKPDDTVTAATSGCVFKAPIDEEHPQRELRLGFDSTETVIHSMKARKQYRTLLD